MRASSFLAPLFFVTSSLAQGVEEGIAPPSPAPAGCDTTVKGNFTIAVENFFAAKPKRETAQEASDGALVCTLEDGILRDQYSRTGSIVANRQFQFDGPPQAGAIYTGGFSVCQNKSLAIGGSTRWWRCMSGAFGNLYDESIGDQCTEIRIVANYVNTASSSSTSALPLSTSVTVSSPTGGKPSATPSAGSNSTASYGSSASSSARAVASASTGSATRSTSSSATGSASGSSSPTASGAAPPASEGATFSVAAQGTLLSAILAACGAVLVLQAI